MQQRPKHEMKARTELIKWIETSAKRKKWASGGSKATQPRYTTNNYIRLLFVLSQHLGECWVQRTAKIWGKKEVKSWSMEWHVWRTKLHFAKQSASNKSCCLSHVALLFFQSIVMMMGMEREHKDQQLERFALSERGEISSIFIIDITPQTTLRAVIISRCRPFLKTTLCSHNQFSATYCFLCFLQLVGSFICP